MELTLYHYIHCPFCIRVRMTLGNLKLPYRSIVLSYDDEKTPIELTGSKMLPILNIDGRIVNESLDIMALIDTTNVLQLTSLEMDPHFYQFNDLLTLLGTNVHNLAMPCWIYTKEFDEKSRDYFQKKKEEKRGPFKELVKNKDLYISNINRDLNDLAKNLTPFYRSETFSVYDILLASHLWGLYVVPEFQFEERIHLYLQKIKEICHFEYQQDLWK